LELFCEKSIGRSSYLFFPVLFRSSLTCPFFPISWRYEKNKFLSAHLRAFPLFPGSLFPVASSIELLLPFFGVPPLFLFLFHRAPKFSEGDGFFSL